MKRVIFVTQQVDPEHPFLAAAVPQIRALAGRVDEVVVLAESAVPGELPSNCRVRSFAAPRRVLRGARFAVALAAELRRPRDLAVLAHMSPIYAVLAAPLARPLRVPVLLWFTHWKASRLLRLGERLSTAVLTVDRTTFPLDSPKVVEIGHGIDVEAFSCTDPPNGKGVSLLALGRYSPAKGLPVVVRAVQVARKAGVDLRLDVYGPAPLEADAVHRRELEALTSELGLADVVAFHDALPPAEVRERLRKADALVNNMRPGAADKVVFEAGAACRPSFAAAHAFGRLLPDSLRFPSDDVDALARRLVDFSRLPVELRADLGRDLRARVRAEHSVDHWADQVVAAAWR